MIPSAVLTFEQRRQARDHAEALRVPCPVCVAQAGEPCCPSSLTVPHLLRVKAVQGERNAPGLGEEPGRARPGATTSKEGK